MDFITGGAYQGTLDFAREQFALRDDEIFTCAEDSEPDWSMRCIVHMERYVYYCLKNGALPEMRCRADAVLLGDDIFCGVVPIDPEQRAWREECGRFYGQLSRRAETVTRLFCGLPLRLKG